ncbi:MAG: hypothetical protein RMI49_01845 [Candidatus Caldarchaeum sp.]|nr:hypothetical protein [Candidatus Caldarchaeum sp.]
MSKLAVECGVWPLKEAVHGEVKHTFVPRILKPVEEYRRRQARFRHLFDPRRQDIIDIIQEQIYRYWLEVKKRENIEIEIPKPIRQKI